MRMDTATFGYPLPGAKRKEYPTAAAAEKGARRRARQCGERIMFFVWWGDAEEQLGTVSPDGKHSDLTWVGALYL